MSPAERANRRRSPTAAPSRRLGRPAVARSAQRRYLGGVRTLLIPATCAVLVGTSACGGGGGGPAGGPPPGGAAPPPGAARAAPRPRARPARLRAAQPR